MKKLLITLLACSILTPLVAQNQVIPLWEGDPPNYRETGEVTIWDTSDIVRVRNVQKPDIAVFLPSKKNSTGEAVVICPGGGYEILAYDWEGSDIARWLNSRGIAAFVLKYRLPGSKSNIVPHKSPLMDAQRAMRLVRFNAAKWNIDPSRIGVMGFSAGGHLASTLSTHYDGGDAGEELIRYYSNELQVTEDTPPAILIHSDDDTAVPAENSIAYYKALRSNKISSELHIYPYGGHGYSLAIGQGHLATWPDRVIEWIRYLYP
ncbi:MAG: alpha/beta hydrolase [Bacteroidales bacterium]|nr:alpha/beta hydrolase [Bacteroidales bacterium]